ncbi:MAG TPA: hypothetical protein PLO62_15425 [Candidatus Hydrogenedentes bacterium]|nr:hypothetical protein [Candidatus Hydrogenedentota bacterium]
MKVNDFAYQVALRTIELLEHTQHYKVPEDLRKDIAAKVLAEVNEILARSK